MSDSCKGGAIRLSTAVKAGVALLVCLPICGKAAAQNLPHFLRDYRADTPAVRMRVTAFADGALNDAIKSGTEPTGSGRVGLRMGLEKYVIQGSISFASTVSEVTDQYGLSVLSPTAGAAAPTAMIEVARPDLYGIIERDHPHNGLSGYVSLAQSNWVRTEVPAGDTLPDKSIANVLGVGLTTYSAFTGALGDNAVGLSFGAGPVSRVIFGEVTPAYREAVLGARNKFYWGFEGFFAITVNGITTFTQVYGIKRRGTSVEGLTGLNAIFGVTVRGNLFKLDIPRDNGP